MATCASTGRFVDRSRAFDHGADQSALAQHAPSATAGVPAVSGRAQRPLRLGGRTFLHDELVVMAVVNRTPDSFFDRGRTYSFGAALDRVDQAVAEGAAIIDIGGVKAGVGDDVSLADERRRVVPLVAAVRGRYPDTVISVDTYRAEVAEPACAAGADLINDVWGGWDPRLAEVAARYGTGLVCAHTGGRAPRTPAQPRSYDDVVADVVGAVTALAERAVACGVRPDGLLVDPAHDFGKEHRPVPGGHPPTERAGGHRMAGVGRRVPQGLRGRSTRRRARRATGRNPCGHRPQRLARCPSVPGPRCGSHSASPVLQMTAAVAALRPAGTS